MQNPLMTKIKRFMTVPETPDDQGVDGMVELLEHIAGYEGQGQEHELGSDIA